LGTQHHQTVLEIKADTSQVREAGAVLDSALSDSAAKRLTTQLEALEGVFERLIKLQERMSDQGFAGGGAGRGTRRAAGGRADPYSLAGLSAPLRENAPPLPAVNPAPPLPGEPGGGAAPTIPSAGGIGAGEAAALGGAAAVIATIALKKMDSAGQWGGNFMSGGGGLAGLASPFFEAAKTAAGMFPGLGLLSTPVIGALSHGLQTLEGAAGGAAQHARGRLGAYPYMGGGVFPFLDGHPDPAIRARASGAAYETAGLDYGMGPDATLNFASGLYRSVGGVNFGGKDLLTTALAAQTLGVSVGTTGSLARTLRPGRGSRNRQNTGTILDSLRQQAQLQGGGGLGGSEIEEFLAHAINTAQAQAAGGNALDYANYAADVNQLDWVGLKGLRPSAVAGQWQQAASRVGRSGPNSPAELAMLMAAGYKPGEGVGSFARAAGALQTGDKPGYMLKMIRSMFGGGRYANMDPDAKQWLVQRTLGSVGMNVGFPEAGTILTGALAGVGPGATALTGSGANLEEEALGVLGRVGKVEGADDKRTLFRRQADQEAELLKAGKAATDSTLKLKDAQISAAKAAETLVPVIRRLAAASAGAAGALEKVMSATADKLDFFFPGGG